MEWKEITPRHYEAKTESFAFEIFQSSSSAWDLYVSLHKSQTLAIRTYGDLETSKMMALAVALEFSNRWRNEILAQMERDGWIYSS